FHFTPILLYYKPCGLSYRLVNSLLPFPINLSVNSPAAQQIGTAFFSDDLYRLAECKGSKLYFTNQIYLSRFFYFSFQLTSYNLLLTICLETNLTVRADRFSLLFSVSGLQR
ncbi:hypothetical protein, partial [Arachidicoccus ginsenosidivorans]